MTGVSSGALIVDFASFDEVTDGLVLINNFPYDGQVDVPSTDIYGSHPIALSLMTVNGETIDESRIIIHVETVLGRDLVWDGSAFHSNWLAHSSVELFESNETQGFDEARFRLHFMQGFASLEWVKVYVEARTDLETLITDYTFQIEDLTAPEIELAYTQTLPKVVIQFNEDLDMAAMTNVRDISGNLTIVPRNGLTPARIIAASPVFLESDVGLFLGIIGADVGLNNDIFQVTDFISTRELYFDGAYVSDEVLSSDTLVTLSGYRILGVPDAALQTAYYDPVVASAEYLAPNKVLLHLDMELTAEYPYYIETYGVADLKGNTNNGKKFYFTSEGCGPKSGERWKVEEMLPDYNFSIDQSGDFTRLVSIIQEVYTLLVCDVDTFSEAIDFERADESRLDLLLAHYGNPFSFATSLSANQKRKLLSILVDTYKRGGVENAMESLAALILGFEVDVRPYNNPEDTWRIGEDELGIDTILGPGEQRLLYSFEIEIFVEPTDIQLARLLEIIYYMKPAHTHLIRIITPEYYRLPSINTTGTLDFGDPGMSGWIAAI